MQGVIDVSWGLIGLFSLLMVIPFILSRHYQLGISKDTLVSIGRMAVQLALVGLYLEYLFLLESFVVNALWVIVMVVVGASSIIGKAHLPKHTLFFCVASGLGIGLLPVLATLCLVIIQPHPFFATQVFIPLAGMLLGNSLSGNIVALQNFFTLMNERKDQYEAAISLGASPRYAVKPFITQAMQKAYAPLLASMSTTGLVTLPGMMTGQILGGSPPMVAIKYQLLIMMAIFLVLVVSVTVTLELAVTRCIESSGRVRVNFLSE